MHATGRYKILNLIFGVFPFIGVDRGTETRHASESNRLQIRYTRVVITVMYVRVMGNGNPADNGRAYSPTHPHNGQSLSGMKRPKTTKQDKIIKATQRNPHEDVKKVEGLVK